MKCKHCKETVRLGFNHHCRVQNREIIVVQDDSDFIMGVVAVAPVDDVFSSGSSDSSSGGGGESGGGGASGDW